MIKLYQAGMSTCVQKVRFVLEQKGIPWEGIAVDLNGGENYSAEYMKINPKAIIPVLDDDGDMVFESANICMYLDEKYPDTPLMPSDFKGRADVRAFAQLIDEQVHTDASACTYAIAFGPRIRAKYDTPEKLQAYLDGMPDYGRRHLKEQVITKGIECTEVEIAVRHLDAMLQRLEGTLQNADYLVGNQLSIADIVYVPYITRLTHLNMSYMWADKPGLIAWFERMKETKGYKQGMEAYFVPEVIARMGDGGTKAEPSIRKILAS